MCAFLDRHTAAAAAAATAAAAAATTPALAAPHETRAYVERSLALRCGPTSTVKNTCEWGGGGRGRTIGGLVHHRRVGRAGGGTLICHRVARPSLREAAARAVAPHLGAGAGGITFAPDSGWGGGAHDGLVTQHAAHGRHPQPEAPDAQHRHECRVVAHGGEPVRPARCSRLVARMAWGRDSSPPVVFAVRHKDLVAGPDAPRCLKPQRLEARVVALLRAA